MQLTEKHYYVQCGNAPDIFLCCVTVCQSYMVQYTTEGTMEMYIVLSTASIS